MPGYLGRFVDSLAERCEHITCFLHTPRADEQAQMDSPLLASNVSLVNIGRHDSTPRRTLFARRYTRHLHTYRDKLDAMLIRGPSPLLPQVADAIRPVPTALLLVGDYVAGISDLPQPRWRKEAIRLWSQWNEYMQVRVARRSLTFVNSRLLYNKLSASVPNLVETRTTTLSQNDFYERTDTCHAPPFRLLYTGRMDRAKGLFEMVEALALLVEEGCDVLLDMVGWPAQGDDIISELQVFAEQRGVSSRLHYHGYKPVGPELFAFYEQADVYVIASKTSEGFPRTIWEAMAHSLPVVATTVGSIPYFLVDRTSALLIEPNNSVELANAVRQILFDKATRQKLIFNGLSLAKENTLERRANEVMTQINRWTVEKAHAL